MKYKNKTRLFLVGIGPFVFSLAAFAQTVDQNTTQDVSAAIDRAVNDSNGKVQVTNNKYEVSGNAPADFAQTQQDENKPAVTEKLPDAISIDAPKQREMMTNTSVRMFGKAPISVLLDVLVIDEDVYKKTIIHEDPVRISGTTTSDKTGEWVFVPQFQLVPGDYSVVITYKDATKGSISSEKIFFTVSDSMGATSWPLISRNWIYLGIFILVVLIGGGISYWIWRYNVRQASDAFHVSARIVDTPLKFKKEIAPTVALDMPALNDGIENFYFDKNTGTLNEVDADVEPALVKKVAQAVVLEMSKEITKEIPQRVVPKNEEILEVKTETVADLQSVKESATKLEKELLKVSREINNTMQEVGQLRQEIIAQDHEDLKTEKEETAKKIKKKSTKKKSLSGNAIKVEKELIDVAQAVNSTMREVENLRESIAKKV